ncbi:sugar ABC transporter substrate-binding protein, partial [Mesorhizobium sp. M00.F.Ca.ET.149.01.1.1]
MLNRNLVLATALLLSGSTTMALAGGPNVEVMHYWTSGSEAAGLNVLKKLLEERGSTCTMFIPVPPATGESLQVTPR